MDYLKDYRCTILALFSCPNEYEKAADLLAKVNCEMFINKELPGQNQSLSSQSHLSECLTAREKEVLTMLSKGYSYSESALLIGCRISTIQTYVKRVYRKLQVHSKSEAIYEAVKNGQITL